ncbi:MULTISPECIES: MFS transporter [Nocardia]|jgi:MFS family permease|uniref:Putative MFS family arabinose efflux permease n=2 Tax=Nocardia TaxID=1817 RepID=A0A366CTY6_9NOCA|nr:MULTISPECIES: MFS transporter [Nocardia]AVH20837.1 MFS transporter [Nocardia cyriacigeorgica]MBF6188570.1 MFS transporter [Nocardia farcinica]MBF6326709.1 MFS transporter [Nocardia cyriacigeorgica]MBF6541167.1 MFS transporter [Nocardia farcinica]RBO79538.1 putative MFS family arabinose efflux permease [Nocardia puris]
MQVVSTPTAPAATGLRRVLVVLCVTEITSWGILFYAFPVLLGSIATDTGWSATALTGVFSAGQLLTALTGILVGRRLDRHGPRTVMTAGSALAVTALIVVATAQTPRAFLLGWALAGISMGAVLYPPAFAALTRWYGPDQVKALTVLTLAGGLASTVFAPLTAALATRFDWRATYLILAAILAVVTIPGHWFGLRLAWPTRPEEGTEHAHLGNPGSIARSRAFITLAIALSVTGFASFAVVVTLVPLMTERGISTTTAALALGLGGLGQVVSRIGYSAFADRTSVRTRTAIILIAIAATTMLLGIFTTAAALTVAAILSGMARGVFTLLQATAITDRWGSAHYGQLTGLVSAPMTITIASAPFVATALAANLGGYPATFLILGTAAALAAALSLTTIPKHSPKEQHS